MTARKIPEPAPTVRLYYFEYVDNNLGLYTKSWFPTEGSAKHARRTLLEAPDSPYFGVDVSEMTGQYGELSQMQYEDVELSAAGVLAFAREHAAGD